MAGVSIVMKYGSVKGEAGIGDGPEKIIINSISHSGNWSRTGVSGTENDPASSTLELAHLVISRPWDISSPGLLLKFQQGAAETDKVTIKAVTGDGGKNNLATYELEKASIASWNMTQDGSSSATENLVLVCSKLHVTGFAFDDEGKQDSNLPTAYDFEQGKTI